MKTILDEKLMIVLTVIQEGIHLNEESQSFENTIITDCFFSCKGGCSSGCSFGCSSSCLTGCGDSCNNGCSVCTSCTGTSDARCSDYYRTVDR